MAHVNIFHLSSLNSSCLPHPKTDFPPDSKWPPGAPCPEATEPKNAFPYSYLRQVGKIVFPLARVSLVQNASDTLSQNGLLENINCFKRIRAHPGGQEGPGVQELDDGHLDQNFSFITNRTGEWMPIACYLFTFPQDKIRVFRQNTLSCVWSCTGLDLTGCQILTFQQDVIFNLPQP